MTEVATSLTVSEEQTLTDCEETITRGFQTFVEVGTAYATIRDGRLYRKTHPTFEAYCQERWGLTRRRVNQVIESAAITQDLGNIFPNAMPANELQASELVGLQPEVAAEVMNKAQESGKITAASIAEAREEILEPEPPTDPFANWSEEEHLLRKQLLDGETIVINMRSGAHTKLQEWADGIGLFTRIDRRSDWGNPFEIPDDGDRETVIDKFSQYYLPHKAALQFRLHELRGKVLGCWCAPEPCHGDILKAKADQ